MQGTNNYVPETNRVSTVFNVATLSAFTVCVPCIAISPVKYVLYSYFYISTFRSLCAVPNMAVFCSSLISCFPDMLLRYCLRDFEMVPVAPIITGITYCYYNHHHHKSLILIVIIIIIIVSFMQGIYTYIPETNYVPREYSVAAILLLLFTWW